MSCFDTCFFERYAHETLKRCLGHEFDDLVNRDRPDLQSPDGRTWGIEVTRAMEESKAAAETLLDKMSGLTVTAAERRDVEQSILTGYGYGLETGRIVGAKESLYWSMALPMKRILESKVAKMTGGFYGEFSRTGLYVFCKDEMSEADILGACRYVLDLQKYCDNGYDFLYLSEVDTLHVCNLSRDLSNRYRISELPISAELRRSLYLSALEEPAISR